MPYGYNVDQTPIPQVKSPIDSAVGGVTQGITLGLGLQRARQDAQANQLQQQAAMQEMERKKQQADLDKFGEVSSFWSKLKNKKSKEIVYETGIKPLGSKLFGVDFPDQLDDSYSDYFGAAGELYEQYKNPDNNFSEKDYANGLMSLALRAQSEGDTESAKGLLEASKAVKSEKELSPYQQFNQQKSVEDRTAEFRNRLVTSEPYKNFSDITGKASTIEKMVIDPGAFGDLGILFDYMKALDPTSVVREGEQERFKATGSLSTRGANALNALVSGKTLTPEQRQEVLKYTKLRQKSAFDIYQTHAKPTVEQAKRLNLNLSEIDPYFGQKFEIPNSDKSNNAPYGNVVQQNGKTYRWNGTEYVEGE